MGTQIRGSERATVLALANTALPPIEVTFDTADCIEFPDIRIIKDYPLGSAH